MNGVVLLKADLIILICKLFWQLREKWSQSMVLSNWTRLRIVILQNVINTSEFQVYLLLQSTCATALMHAHPTGNNISPNFWPCRLVYVTSNLMAVVLFAAYSATFISFLTVRSYQLPFTDFQGLASNGKYKLGMVFGSGNMYYFQVIILVVNYILTIIWPYVHILIFFKKVIMIAVCNYQLLFCLISNVFLLYLLTYSMEQSPSWEANWFCS